MYPYGAPSVKCAICHFITNVTMTNERLRIPVLRSNGTVPSNSSSMPLSHTQTIIVQNPMTVDSTGKLVFTIAFLFSLVLDPYLTGVCF
uniref:Zinc finger LSD1-type domain-containing protein n=1 Tax=Cajanus cajan TaxID=3821 RepID=A0A151UGB1_CAJCA